MSSHALDNQLNERLFKELEEVKKQLRDLRTLQTQGGNAVNDAVESYVNLNLSPTTGATAAGITNNNVALFRFRFTNSESNLVFSNFYFSLYQGSVAAGNLITAGGVNILNYDWYWWRDEYDSLADGNNRATDYVYVRNRSGATQTIICRAYYRYIVSAGTTTTS
jgi:hypothetical protein